MQPPSTNAAQTRRRWVALGVPVLLFLILLLLLLVTCDAGEDPPDGGAVPPVTVRPTPTTGTGSPADSGATPPRPRPPGGPSRPTDLEVYKARCREAAGELALARVIYDPKLTMELGRSETVEALVTFNKSLAPPSALPGHTGATAQTVAVSCQVQARLRGAANEFDIEPKGWELQALFEDRTARWVWQVVPRSGGRKTLIMDLQPAIRIDDRTDLHDLDMQGAIEPFTTEVTVTVPVDKSIESWFDRAGKIIPVVTAFLAGVAGVLGLFQGRAWWRRRSGGRSTLIVEDPAEALEDLRNARIKQGVDATRLARILGISRADLHALEDGRMVPTFRHVYDYASALGIDLVFRASSEPYDRRS